MFKRYFVLSLVAVVRCTYQVHKKCLFFSITKEAKSAYFESFISTTHEIKDYLIGSNNLRNFFTSMSFAVIIIEIRRLLIKDTIFRFFRKWIISNNFRPTFCIFFCFQSLPEFQKNIRCDEHTVGESKDLTFHRSYGVKLP